MDIKLYYEEKGKGYPFIMIHGNGGSGEYFVHQVEYFKNDFRVITPDTRGHGRSPRGTGEFTIARFADDLNDFMDELKIDKAIIFGFSDGANIAMDFAIKYENRVKLLVLDGGNLTDEGTNDEDEAQIKADFARAKEEVKTDPSKTGWMEMLGLMVDSPNIAVEDLNKLSVETLVVAGTHDMIKESETKKIAASIKNSELVILEGGHCVANENPELFNKTLEAYLRKHNAYNF